ncbi:MAG: NusG domain II-containing protein [Nitrospirae bacterium]|nr:NusG domain II-containing protein [Nitrospirota bacterium]
MKLKQIINLTTAADLVLLGAMLVITTVATVFVSVVRPKGAEVIVEVNNKVIYRLSLNMDKELNIGTMTIEIKDSRVRVKDADCPNQLCIRQSWIDRGSIICLPNRVVISISNQPHKGQEVDATTG